MEPVFICFWETRDHTYQGFGRTPEEAKKACLRGYRKMCKAVSGYRLTKDDLREFNEAVWTEQVQIDKCLVDEGREGWI